MRYYSVVKEIKTAHRESEHSFSMDLFFISQGQHALAAWEKKINALKRRRGLQKVFGKMELRDYF